MEALSSFTLAGTGGRMLGESIRLAKGRLGAVAGAAALPERRGATRVMLIIGLVVCALGAIGLLGGGAALGAVGPGQQSRATFSVDVEEPGMTLGTFLAERTPAAPQPRGFEDVSIRESLGLRLQLVGSADIPREKRLRVRWSMFEDGTDRPVAMPFFRSQPAFPTPIYVPLAREESHAIDIWLPRPPGPGRYYVRVQLAEGDRVLFDERSEAFIVA
jgi:hypothetical protein